MREVAIYTFVVLMSAAVICWYISSNKESRRLYWLAVALAAAGGFTLTLAIGIHDLLCSLSVAALAAIGFGLRTFQVDYLRRQAGRDGDRISKALGIASAVVLAGIGATVAAGWLYIQKRILHKQ